MPPNNIDRDKNGIEIPEVWMPRIKQHNSLSVPQQNTEGTTSNHNIGDRNPPITNNYNKDQYAPITNSQDKTSTYNV